MNASTISQTLGRFFASATRGLAPLPPGASPALPRKYISRFDVVDHGLELPDIAQFPELGDITAYPSGTATEQQLYASFQQALQQCDSELFTNSIEQLDRSIEKFAEFDAELREIKQRQLGNTLSIGRWYLNYKAQWNARERSDLAPNPAYDVLKQDGVHASHIDTQALNAILEHEISALLQREVTGICEPGQGYDRSKMFFNNGEHNALFAALRSEMHRHGILEAATKYQNSQDLDFKHACLHICTPNDTHFTQTLQDCPTTSQLIGLHIDPKPVMKIIVYLNHVTEGSGPFSYVPGSHRWKFDEVELLFAKGNSTGNYLHSPKHRWVAAKFPPIFRKNSIIGRFILDGTKTSDLLLQAERKYTSQQGNCIVFDPGNGLHRGGICTQDNRINLQIALH